jgi:hypothetical protein
LIDFCIFTTNSKKVSIDLWGPKPEIENGGIPLCRFYTKFLRQKWLHLISKVLKACPLPLDKALTILFAHF